jgi:membrane protein implicated in regulation of membrane protease activity
MRWIGCAAFFIGWCLLPVIENEFRRVEIGFTVTAASLLAMLYVIYRRPVERPEDVPDPGSSEELEGLVAAADEAG